MASLVVVFISALLAMAALDITHAVEYQATNNATGTPGGVRFDQQIGIAYSEETLETASEFIWQTFQQGEEEKKDVSLVSMSVYRIAGISYTVYDKIFLSTDYMAGYSGDLKMEVTGIIYHETAHVWQWKGNGRAPSGLIEGIADFVRLKAGYAPAHWMKPGGGDRWDSGYDVTALFLDYCNGLKGTFVAELNALLKGGYSERFFLELLGKTVDELWTDYKAAYSG